MKDKLQIYEETVLSTIFAGIIKNIIFFNWRLITSQYCGGFGHTLTWISHGCTCVPHPETPSHIPPHPIPQGCPNRPAWSVLFHALNLDCWSISYMVIYTFQSCSLKSSHPRLLPKSPKDCSIHLCLSCCRDFFKKLFIYFWLHWVFLAAGRLSLVVNRSYSLALVLRLLVTVVFLVAEHGL